MRLFFWFMASLMAVCILPTVILLSLQSEKVQNNMGIYLNPGNVLLQQDRKASIFH